MRVTLKKVPAEPSMWMLSVSPPLTPVNVDELPGVMPLLAVAHGVVATAGGVALQVCGGVGLGLSTARVLVSGVAVVSACAPLPPDERTSAVTSSVAARATIALARDRSTI